MIRYKLSGQKHITIGGLLLGNVVLYFMVRWFTDHFSFTIQNPDAPLNLYMAGTVASGFLISQHLDLFLRKELRAAPFASLALGSRFALIQAASFALLYFFFKDVASSRFILGTYLLLSWPASTLWLYLSPGFLRRYLQKYQGDKAVLIGEGMPPQSILNYVKQCRQYGIEFVGYYNSEPLPQGITDLPFLGVVDHLDYTDTPFPEGVEVALFHASHLSNPRIVRGVLVCQNQGLRTELYAAHPFEKVSGARFIQSGNLQFLTFLEEPLRNPFNILFKRTVDICLSLIICLTILPPLALLVWIVQRFQAPGPLFFKQKRLGMNRYSFQILKFRTMYEDPERTTESKQAQKSDPRVYPFGRFLRKTSLDELPQILNVLMGEMSLIGPRPHLVEHDARFEKELYAYRIRHFVKPGITGYAQINGLRGEISSPEEIALRVEKDVFYINHWSPRLEIYILLKTLWIVIFPQKSAY